MDNFFIFNKYKKLIKQLYRYAVVGIANNIVGYLIYLVVTYFWLNPTTAITLLYPVGAVTAYFGHSKYSFSYGAAKWHTLWRYALAHLMGYGVNYLMLYVFWERFNFPHQVVQATAIFICAGVLFLLFKYFVFPPSWEGACNPPR